MDQDIQQKETYFVAVKVFLEHNGKLLILKDNFGDWDLPGGRIKKDEFSAPLEDVVKRKLSEELGSDIGYIIDEKPEIFLRHERIEASPGNPKVRIFALGYIGKFLTGTITLSPRHTEILWVDPKTFVPENYFKGGWLTGVKEYLKQRSLSGRA